MTLELINELSDYLVALADDELILGHRNSEWAGHAPILEEDIAFANIALDEMGHAMVWYGLAAELKGEGPEAFADRMAFHRSAANFRCVQFVELPNEDWGVSMMRQYLFDTAESHWLARLTGSEHRPLAEAAVKIAKEEIYHLRHTSVWIRRLAQGTEESKERIQSALDSLWTCAFQLFEPQPYTEALVEAKLVPDPGDMKIAWESEIRDKLTELGLKVPTTTQAKISDRAEHSKHLAPLINEMQSVARLDPDAKW